MYILHVNVTEEVVILHQVAIHLYVCSVLLL
jgi:hypothetical protein